MNKEQVLSGLANMSLDLDKLESYLIEIKKASSEKEYDKFKVEFFQVVSTGFMKNPVCPRNIGGN